MPKLTSNLTGETIAQILASKGYEINQDTADTIGVSLCHLRKILNNKAAAPLILEKALDGLPDLTPPPAPMDDVPRDDEEPAMLESEARAKLVEYCSRRSNAEREWAELEKQAETARAALRQLGGVAYYQGHILELTPGGTSYAYPAEITERERELNALREASRKEGTATKLNGAETLKFTCAKGCVL